MKHLIVYAHPNPNSFNNGIKESLIKASEKNGHEVVVRDLYELNFEPVLKGSDFELFQKGQVAEDIKKEQEYIKWADVITFVYPVWWTGFPAILKGYVDRVFSYGFAYAYVDGVPKGLLTGKKALLFSTTGTPSEIYGPNGMLNAMKKISDEGIFGFTDVEVLDHVFFCGIPAADEAALKNYLKEVENTVTKYLG
ncbi:NAD(P)H-dependent oxidoreductase [Ectobacillus polymachus]|uniref:NAD(P)H-dependent oxidoreductase n=1 Tax=Ectobacillus polymachus TaxID=1508806 RepID=UPI003A89814E